MCIPLQNGMVIRGACATDNATWSDFVKVASKFGVVRNFNAADEDHAKEAWNKSEGS